MIDKHWIDIPGFEGLYQVSSLGDVLSRKRLQIYMLGNTEVHRFKYSRLLSVNSRGQVRLMKDGKSKVVKLDRLVATLFVPNLDGYKYIRHLDRDEQNCRYSNLIWCNERPKYTNR